MTALERAKEVIRIMAIVYGSDRSNYTRAERALADLVAEIEAAPSVKVKGKVDELAYINVSHSLSGKRVKILEVGE